MPHIPLPDALPGIAGLLTFKPPAGRRLAELMHELLRGASPLTPAEREAIAVHVSQLNDCEFCARSHAATIGHLDGDGDPARGEKLQALLQLATQVTAGGHRVTEAVVADCRAAGATDEDIHDTVLIASAFCMLNRYVDGLAAVTPTEQEQYDRMGARLARDGYRRSL
jgi:uncharacterized peroxidase-related enzyme